MSAILLIDDEQQVLEVLGEMLRLEGHDVECAGNGLEAMEKTENHHFDLVITDLIMPEKEGLETIVDLRKSSENLPILAMSGGGRIGPRDYLETAKFVGANATLMKPFARAELIATIDELLSPAA